MFTRILVLILALQTPVWADEFSTKLFKPESTCARTFFYHNRSFPLDSSRKEDGEGLRFLVKTNPQAEAMLNDYQNHAGPSYIPAFIGTLGLGIIVGGVLYAPNLTLVQDQTALRFASATIGILTILGAYGYGQNSIRTNEKTLEKTIETYNVSAKEADKIRVGVIPTADMRGGTIKTIVPF